MDSIDLNATISKDIWMPDEADLIKTYMKEVARQVLELAAEKAVVVPQPDCSFSREYIDYVMVDKQSILGVLDLVK